MSKWIDVKCVAVQYLMVEIEDDKEHEDAVNIAAEKLGSAYETFESTDVNFTDIVTCKNHADIVLEI